MIYGYIRVSTDKQTVENQRFEISCFCNKQNLNIDSWIEETISGSKEPEKRKLGKLLARMTKGDVLICAELSRLGRNLLMIMGILNGIFKSRDKPQNATSGSAYRFFIGGSSSGKNVNERSAMQMTAVYSCVRILSEAVASLPLHVYKYNGDGGKEKAVKHPLYFLLHDEPNPEMTSFVFRETLMTHLLLGYLPR